MLGGLKMPVLFIQEGGYRNRYIGVNARNFFKGFYEEYIHNH